MGFAGFGDFGFDFDIDFSEFDFSGIEEAPLESCVYSRPLARKVEACAYEYAQDFARGLTIDNETETFAFVSGNFVFGDVLEALVEEGKISVRRLGIQTLSMNDENIDSIRNILEMQPVEALDIVLSDYWYSHENHKNGLVPYLFEELDLEDLELHVAFAGVHSKIVTVETLKGNTLTMHGSANLRSSGNVEQLHISPDRGLYEFCDSMTQRILTAFDVVNQDNRKRKKSVRRSKLWQAVAKQAEAEPKSKEAATAEAPETDGSTEAQPKGEASEGAPEDADRSRSMGISRSKV